jgi:rod shape-determining protein MreD
MNNSIKHIARFIGFVLLQVLVLNHVLLYGYVNPYLYVLFIILLPLNQSKIKTLFFSFLLGLSIDFFSDTGGVHAMACLFTAYVRPLVLRFSFGINYDYQTLKFYEEGFKQRITYVSLLVFTHHLVMFSMEAFQLKLWKFVVFNTLYSFIFTTVLSMLVIALIGNKKK